MTYLCTFLALALVLALLVGLALGMKPLGRYVGALGAQKPAQIVVQWPKVRTAPNQEPVTWIPEDQRTQLMQSARTALSASPEALSGDALERVGVAMAGTGWFSGKPTIRRDLHNAIVIDGRWRVPAAVVRRDGMDQLVSWEGFPMPLRLASGQAKFPVIDAPAGACPTLPDGGIDHDTAWAGEDMAASLELLQFVLKQPWGSQISGIDAAKYTSEHQLVLTTTFGSRVVWGGRVSRPALGEVSSAQKLAHMDELFAKDKRIDGGFPLIYVNNSKLQFDISATAQALAQQIDPTVANVPQNPVQNPAQGGAPTKPQSGTAPKKPRGE